MHTLHLLNVPDHAAPYPPKQLTAQFIFHIFKSSCKCRRISVHTGRCPPDRTSPCDLPDENKLLLVHKALLLVYLLLNSFLNLILPYIRLTSQTCKRMCLGVYQGVPTEFPSIHKTGASSCYGRIRLFLYITYLFYTISFTCHAYVCCFTLLLP